MCLNKGTESCLVSQSNHSSSSSGMFADDGVWNDDRYDSIKVMIDFIITSRFINTMKWMVRIIYITFD